MILNGVVFIIALLHLYFLILEMFLWTKPYGLKNFNITLEFAKESKALAMNMGLYNGFLSAGLVWSLLTDNPTTSLQIKLFFLGCVFIAGIFGGLTANKKIFFIQALPAFIGIVLALSSEVK